MTHLTAKQLLPLITAFANGETIQRQMPDGSWTDCKAPKFDRPHPYRIKPPEPREWTLAVAKGNPGYPDGTISEQRSNQQDFSQYWVPIRVREILD